MNRIGVVIVTYNRLDLLKECISAIFNQTRNVEKIIIINNASNDGTKEYLEEYNSNDLFYIQNLNNNIGGAGGFREGLKYALESELDWVVIIDDDAILRDDYILKIDEAISKNPDNLAFSGTVMVNGEIDQIHRRNVSFRLLYRESLIDKKEYEKEYFLCDLATFCGLVVNVPLIKKIGLPKQDYFIQFDDTEYSFRILKHSRIMNINSAILDHKTVVPNNKAQLDWKGFYGIRNKLDVIKLHCNNTCYQLFRLRVWGAMLKSSICACAGKHKSLYKYSKELYKDALKDDKNGILGKKEKYLPNK